MSFGFHPEEIATRGRFDGQYGIATRGYFILPDIVPRFPARALVTDLDLIGSIGDELNQTLVGQIDPDAPPHC